MTETAKAKNRCHNPLISCDNDPGPGQNFCRACKVKLGMISELKKTTTKAHGYRYPIIGMGPAGQTHLQIQREEKAMEEKDKTQTTSEKKSASLKKLYEDSPRSGVFFDGIVRKWITEQAQAAGVSFQTWVRTLVWERMPAETVKAMLMDEMRKGK